MTVAEAIKMPNEHVFVPGGENSRSFRNALGAFTTGVTVVTATTPEGPIGMTVNSFASVSLDPPLVLWSPAKNSSRYPAFSGATHFAIHVLSADQDVLSARFTRNGRAFDDLDWEINDEGVPVIPGTLARFECRSRRQPTMRAITPSSSAKCCVPPTAMAIPCAFQAEPSGGFQSSRQNGIFPFDLGRDLLQPSVAYLTEHACRAPFLFRLSVKTSLCAVHTGNHLSNWRS